MPDTIEIYGHRGSRLRRPDNTIDSFRLALEEGADGFETDVRQLADGSIVLYNADFVGNRPTHECTFDEVAATTPDLARLRDLTAVPEGVKILEIKRGGFEDRLVDEIGHLSSVVLCSFDHRVIERLAELRESARATWELGVTVTGHLIDGASYVSSLGARWFFPASSFVDADTVATFTARGISVVPWVMNRESEWRAALDWGCHGVITDTPLEATRWRDSSGPARA